MSYVFLLDASACSGCKACQAACKDKNQLPLGVLWRRVYEVSGGEWKQAGPAWNNTVFATTCRFHVIIVSIRNAQEFARWMHTR